MHKTKNKKQLIIPLAILFVIIALILGLNYAKKSSKKTILTQLKNNGHSQMMGYIIKTDNDKTIVIDGGTFDDTQNLIDHINKYTRKSRLLVYNSPSQRSCKLFYRYCRKC